MASSDVEGLPIAAAAKIDAPEADDEDEFPPKAPSIALGGKVTGGGALVTYFLLALGGTSLT